MATATGTLPSLTAQAERLIALGLHEVADIPAGDVRAWTAQAEADVEQALLVVHPERIGASVLAPVVQVHGRPGFVVSDFEDVDAFTPIDEAKPPDAALYLVRGPDRGDAMRNWTPDEAIRAIRAEERTPLTLGEGLHWVLQQPAVLERNYCFMTIGSRRRLPDRTLDARTPAIWISNGTGRDGRERRGAPKVGWCWAGNRHTWLGFASAAGRLTI